MSIKKTIKKNLKMILRVIAAICKPFTNTVIVMIDGGICSQMHQYLQSLYYVKKGYSVQYDLRFFKHGTDMYGQQVRNFDHTTAFPNIIMPNATPIKLRIYDYLYKKIGNFPFEFNMDWLEFQPPFLMWGYYPDTEDLFEHYSEIYKVDPRVMDAENQAIYNNIPVNSVAVHVRRGDLTEIDTIGLYGIPASKEYFKNSFKYMIDTLGNPKFYFFSDGPDYVKEHLIPLLPANIEVQFVENGADKGFCDMFLISKCSHCITSKGSLGKYGAALNPNKGIVVLTKDEKQLGPLVNSNKDIVRI